MSFQKRERFVCRCRAGQKQGDFLKHHSFFAWQCNDKKRHSVCSRGFKRYCTGRTHDSIMSSMEDLNKTQLILLALLVSFVTSIATGITTVTLLEQAPPAITQTINRVVKETVRVVTPTESKPAAQQTVTQTVVVKEEDFVVKAVEKNSPNLVNIGYVTTKGFSLGTLNVGTQTQEVEFASVGFVFSPEGFVVLPNTLFNDERLVVAESLSGEVSYNIVIRKRDEARGLALVQLALPTPEDSKEPAKLSFAQVALFDSDKVRLG